VGPYRATVMLPVVVNVPLAGSYNSAVAPTPLTTSTFPLGRSVAVSELSGTVMLPVAVNVPVAGSYSSAVAVVPPASSTMPLGRSVAELRATVMLPVTANVPVAGSYSSAVVVEPPVTSTNPLSRSVAVRALVTTVMLPVAVNVPLSGSHPCQVSGHITYSGNVKGTADTVTGAWSVYGSATFQLGDPTNNLNDCRVTADVILGGTLYLTLAGNNAEGMGATLNGTITVNRRGATGGLSPRGSCFVMLTVPRGGTRATGSVCGHSVN